MGKTRDLLKKIRDTKGTFYAKMGTIKDRNGMGLTEAEDTKTRWQEYTESESEVSQSCQTLCDPVDYSLLGSSVHGVAKSRTRLSVFTFTFCVFLPPFLNMLCFY